MSFLVYHVLAMPSLELSGVAGFLDVTNPGRDVHELAEDLGPLPRMLGLQHLAQVRDAQTRFTHPRDSLAGWKTLLDYLENGRLIRLYGPPERRRASPPPMRVPSILRQ